MPKHTVCRKIKVSRVSDLCPGYAQSRKRQSDAILSQARGKASTRKYGAGHRDLRRRYLYRHPFCTNPTGSMTCAKIANELDHIDGNAENNAPGNLQALCKSCHSKKSLREQGSGGFLSKKYIEKRKVQK